MWANETTRQAQSNPPWPPGTIVTPEVLAQYADWKQVPDDYELPRDLSEERVKKLTELYTAFCVARDAIVWIDGKGYDSNIGDLPNFLASQKRADLKGESYYKVYTDSADLTQKEFLPHTPAMFSAALLAGGDQQEAAYIRFGLKRTAVMAATTIAGIDAVAWEGE